MSPTQVANSFESSILKLQREHKTVVRWLTSLKSYKLEPRNYECFVLCQELRNDLTALYWDQKLAIDQTSSLQNKSHFSKKVTQFSERYRELEIMVRNYLIKVG